METAVAGKEGAAVNDNDFPFRKGIPKLRCRKGILRAAGTGYQDGAVDNQEVGIGSRKSVILQIYGLREGQGNEPVRLSVQGSESF